MTPFEDGPGATVAAGRPAGRPPLPHPSTAAAPSAYPGCAQAPGDPGKPGQPLLLVFEDLHWIDAETQALLDSLVESLPTARLLLLVNYRPEYQHGWGSKTYYTQLRLIHSPHECRRPLARLLEDDPSLEPLKPLLIARTGGNPFFLEESVRTLVETGALVGEPGAYRLASPADTSRCPPPCKRCWPRASIACPRRTSACSRPPQSSAPRSLRPSSRRSPTHPRRPYTRVSRVCRPPSFSTRYACSRSRLHLQARPDPRGGLWQPAQERRRVLHAHCRGHRGLSADRLAEQVERLAHHAMRSEVWDKAWPIAGRRGAGDTRSATARPWRILSRRSVPWRISPSTARHGTGHRSALRPARCLAAARRTRRV